MAFLAFMSQNKTFLHDLVQRKVSTWMTNKFERCNSFGYFLKTAKLEQPIIFQNCRQWIGEDIILTVSLKIYWISSLLKRKETQVMFLIVEGKGIYNLS